MKTSSTSRNAVAGLALLLAASITAAEGLETRLEHAIVFTQEPIGDSPQGTCIFCRPGSEGSRVVALSPDGAVTVLSGELVSAADPMVSYDGQRVLFSGKETAADNWDIFEVGADGSGLTRLTQGLGDCRDPIYLARASVTPPNFENKVPWMAFTSTAESPTPSLFAMSMIPVEGRGQVLWQTTYNLEGDAWPTIMADGRVLFSSRQRGRFALMTITWAGDNLNPFFGMHDGPTWRSEAAELPDRTVVFVESDDGPPHLGGRLAQVSLRRPLGSYRVLNVDPGRYRTPHPFPNGDLMVSWRPATGSFGIYRFDPGSGRPEDLLFDDPSWHDVDAQPLLPHAEPIARIPMLEFASVLDIEGFEGAGQLHCMSVYDSVEPEIKDLAPGTVKWARFIQGTPRVSGDENAGSDQKEWPESSATTRILGEAPVEEDGSFFVNIVGNTPFYIELLDAEKEIIHSMKTWIWVRSGSQRGCIGCHEDKELAPQNRATEALLRMQPTALTASPEE